MRNRGELHASQERLNAALAAVDGTRPENEMAAMLASQMAVTHSLAMDMIGRTRRAETLDQLHAFGTLLTRLQRTFTLQIEALAKLKRGGEQTVRVEHVHVYPGGQAIVGNINTPAPGVGAQEKTGGQPHAIGYATSIEMPRQIGAERATVSIPGRSGV